MTKYSKGWAGSHAHARCGLGILLLCLLMGTLSCVKRTRIVTVPERVRQAHTLSRAEIATLLDQRAAAIQSLQSSSMKAYFAGGDETSGKVERYMGVPGYVLAQKPDRLRITLQNPVTKTSLADMLSDGQEVKIWIPRLNKFFVGPANIGRVEYSQANENPLANLRPQHILPMLLFDSPFSKGGDRVFVEEDSDASAKYYVVGELRQGPNSQWQLARRVWVERYEQSVTRERFYAGDGRTIADIRYSRYQEIDGVPVAVRIELQRYEEHYSMTMELDRVRVNPQLQPIAFQLDKPPSAELVLLKERQP